MSNLIKIHWIFKVIWDFFSARIHYTTIWKLNWICRTSYAWRLPTELAGGGILCNGAWKHGRDSHVACPPYALGEMRSLSLSGGGQGGSGPLPLLIFFLPPFFFGYPRPKFRFFAPPICPRPFFVKSPPPPTRPRPPQPLRQWHIDLTYMQLDMIGSNGSNVRFEETDVMCDEDVGEARAAVLNLWRAGILASVSSPKCGWKRNGLSCEDHTTLPHTTITKMWKFTTLANDIVVERTREYGLWAEKPPLFTMFTCRAKSRAFRVTTSGSMQCVWCIRICFSSQLYVFVQ